MKTRMRYILTLGVLFLAVAALIGTPSASASGVAAAPIAAPTGRMAGAPLAALPDATCTVDTAVTPNVRTCELWALAGTVTMPDGAAVPVWGFADNSAGPALVPGPVLRAQAGETLQIVLHNELAGETVALGFPGQDALVPDMEGVATGATATYELDVAQAGTFLYEAGMTAGGARQVAMGLFGALVVESGTPVGDQEVVLVFSEIDPAFNADPANFSLREFKPRYWLINGQAYPDTGWIDATAGATLLMRYLNAGVESHSIGLLGLGQEIVASDGTSLAHPFETVAESIAPGQTREALVRVPAGAATDTLYPLYNASLLHHNNNQRLTDMRAAFGGMLAFIRVTDGTIPSGQGPVASNVSVTPAKTDATVDVTLAATLTDDATNVSAYETFVDTLGAPGTGTVVTVPAPAPSVDVSVVFSAADLATWTSGNHTLYIRGQDDEGNWGLPGSVVLTLDTAGPVISGASLNPNPTNGTVDVALSATANDSSTGNSNVVVGEYRIDGGAWQPMTLSAGGTPVTGMTATIAAATVDAMPEGGHLVEIQAQDDLLNWSALPGAVTLTVDKTGPNVTAAALSPNAIDLGQLPTSVRLTATLEDPLSGGVQSVVANAEAFVGVVGEPGTGFDLYPTDGLFNEAVEDAYYDIPSSAFAALEAGEHQVFVAGLDSAGNWGVVGSASITIAFEDTTGPAVGSIVATPDPARIGTPLILTATATDAQTAIAAVEWFEGTDPTRPRSSGVMTAVDGAFDERIEDVTATLTPINRWRPSVQISVRAQDAAGNWGPIRTMTLDVVR